VQFESLSHRSLAPTVSPPSRRERAFMLLVARCLEAFSFKEYLGGTYRAKHF